MQGAVAAHSGVGLANEGFRHYLSPVSLLKDHLKDIFVFCFFCCSIYVNIHSLLVQLLITYKLLLLFCTNVHSAS